MKLFSRDDDWLEISLLSARLLERRVMGIDFPLLAVRACEYFWVFHGEDEPIWISVSMTPGGFFCSVGGAKDSNCARSPGFPAPPTFTDADLNQLLDPVEDWMVAQLCPLLRRPSLA